METLFPVLVIISFFCANIIQVLILSAQITFVLGHRDVLNLLIEEFNVNLQVIKSSSICQTVGFANFHLATGSVYSYGSVVIGLKLEYYTTGWLKSHSSAYVYALI